MYKVPRAKIHKRRQQYIKYSKYSKYSKSSSYYKLIKMLSKFVDHNNEVYLFQ